MVLCPVFCPTVPYGLATAHDGRQRGESRNKATEYAAGWSTLINAARFWIELNCKPLRADAQKGVEGAGHPAMDALRTP